MIMIKTISPRDGRHADLKVRKVGEAVVVSCEFHGGGKQPYDRWLYQGHEERKASKAAQDKLVDLLDSGFRLWRNP